MTSSCADDIFECIFFIIIFFVVIHISLNVITKDPIINIEWVTRSSHPISFTRTPLSTFNQRFWTKYYCHQTSREKIVYCWWRVIPSTETRNLAKCQLCVLTDCTTIGCCYDKLWCCYRIKRINGIVRNLGCLWMMQIHFFFFIYYFIMWASTWALHWTTPIKDETQLWLNHNLNYESRIRIHHIFLIGWCDQDWSVIFG